ncbi:MAG TPA: 5-deoxy-glucuronate isomerase [Solirubrobacteraceae bacterium]|nr:5-deoxy-glucuronate isomerase [Solirubrobacteraceae bacterium]
MKHNRAGTLLPADQRPPGWRYLGFERVELAAGESVKRHSGDTELALCPLEGSVAVQGGDFSWPLERESALRGPAALVYLPPRTTFRLSSSGGGSVAIGSAPAHGAFPSRLIEPAEMRVEMRGGAAAHRQVVHALAPPLPAERLIVYEVFVPAGHWSGWPPHCHDGEHGSPYLEETYLFHFDRPEGFGFHRNWRGLLQDGPPTSEESFRVGHGDLVLVPAGFHVSCAAPAFNMWVLNFLAGELEGDERSRPPYFDPTSTWIESSWEQTPVRLPVGA